MASRAWSASVAGWTSGRRVGRVGEDFVELHDEQRATRAEGPLVVPFAALVALRGDAC